VKPDMNILDDVLAVLWNMGLTANRVNTPPGFAGLSVYLPNNGYAFFVWSKIDNDDYYFRLARFWANDNPFSMWVCNDLIQAISKTKVLSQ